MLNKNKVFWYVAPTYRQAKEIIWRDPDMLNKYLPKEIIAKKNESELTVTFINGSVLGVKGADDPDSLRGPNPMGTVLDEYAVMKSEVWEEIIAPIAYANPKAWVWFVGTPKPQGAHFKKLHEQAHHKDGWFALTLKATESGILSNDSLEMAQSTMTRSGYRQEFECEWHEDGGVVFRGVDNCIYGDYKEPQNKQKRQWGLDLAKLVDWTVLTGINQKTFEVDVFDRYNQIDYNLQKARIEAIVRRYSFNGDWINADQTGVGEPIIDDLKSVGLNVEGIKFTAETKKNLITNLALGIEQRKLKLPSIPELIEELKVFGYDVTTAGNVRYGAPDGFHDDCVMSLALAWWDIGTQLQQLSSIQKMLAYGDQRKHNLGSWEHETQKDVGFDVE